MKKIFDSINNLLIPTTAKFISNTKIQIIFSSPFNESNDSSTFISIYDLENNNYSQSLIHIHNDSEILTGYTSTGNMRAIFRQINYNKLMPSSINNKKNKRKNKYFRNNKSSRNNRKKNIR